MVLSASDLEQVKESWLKHVRAPIGGNQGCCSAVLLTQQRGLRIGELRARSEDTCGSTAWLCSLESFGSNEGFGDGLNCPFESITVIN